MGGTRHDELFAALDALRQAEDRADRRLVWAWRTVATHIDRRWASLEREHDDVRQRALIKVLRGVGRMDASSPASAGAWLRRVWESARLEQHRSVSARKLQTALRTTPADAGVDFMDRLPAAVSARTEQDLERLDATVERVLDVAHRWLAERAGAAHKRAADYRRAQVALLANLYGLDASAIRSRLGLGEETSKAAIYKWIERGREQVLIPALAESGDPSHAALVELLRGARRADAGRPRPARRGDKAVSPARPRASRAKKGPKR